MELQNMGSTTTNQVSTDIDALQAYIGGRIQSANQRWADAQRTLELRNPWQAEQLREKAPQGQWTSKLTTRR